LVLDFGIALALDSIEHPRRTIPGFVLGTPDYMSPEQAQGDIPIDGRSDVYSLACVAYEMIAGRPPFTGPPDIVVARQMFAEPLPLCCRLPSVPHGLTAAVSRALAKSPAGRFATIGAFVAAMREGCPTPESDRTTEIGGIEHAVEWPAVPPPRNRQSA
jgi:serine/threonine-protein kinase